MVVAARKESNFTVLTINEIMDEQMSQISRVAELFEVREPRSRVISVNSSCDVYCGLEH